jgi:uncharacterized protein YbaR (Trm112 family)
MDKYLEVLCCPVCKNDLELTSSLNYKCVACKALYDIVGGIPIMIDKTNPKGE